MTTSGAGAIVTGHAEIDIDAGAAPYGTAVFAYRADGVTVSEAGVPASPPTRRARVFVDYRSSVPAIPARSDSGNVEVNTGIAVVNHGPEAATVIYTLRDIEGKVVTVGRSSLEPGRHMACYIDQLQDVMAADFELPADFGFGSLDLEADQPISVVALRGITNQRGDYLMTTTPVADLSQPPATGPIYFPHFADGGGYTTSLVLLNTSGVFETGRLVFRNRNANPLVVTEQGGLTGSSFSYAIPPGGLFRFQSDGASAEITSGWVALIPDSGTPAPVGSGIFGYNPRDMLVSESGIPSAAATKRARVYVDLSENYNTGIALANLAAADSEITIKAFETDGVTAAGSAQETVSLPGNGYQAAFADQFIAGLPGGFTGVLDISSTSPFAALTLRTLANERDEMLMTTFPVADMDQPAPAPVAFPHIANGGGYTTQFILLSSGGAADTILQLYDESGIPLDPW